MDIGAKKLKVLVTHMPVGKHYRWLLTPSRNVSAAFGAVVAEERFLGLELLSLSILSAFYFGVLLSILLDPWI